jgi:predicted ribosomally synthesized peptide with SipW-like signal peptide
MTQHKTRKLAAIGVGALVIGVGATYTLASWNDSEWVYGGLEGVAGIGSSVFEVQQNATAPYAAGGSWGDYEINGDYDTDNGNGLKFTTDALALTPGDTVFAPVALRTTELSVAGTVALQAAVPAVGVAVVDANAELWSAVRVSVYTATGDNPPSGCTTGFVATGWTQIVADAPLATAEATTTQDLDEKAGSTQHYCFALTLPAGASDDLQGRTIAPAWEFASVSE